MGREGGFSWGGVEGWGAEKHIRLIREQGYVDICTPSSLNAGALTEFPKEEVAMKPIGP